jgi:hypothetical protein
VMEAGEGRAVRAEEAPSVKLLGADDGRLVYEVGSGRYLFRVAGATTRP